MTKIEEIELIINKFIEEEGYKDNKHVLGVIFCGSYLTGLYREGSDIDLQIIFDDNDPNHMIRGNDNIDGIRIEYFEKPLADHYAQIEDNLEKQDNAIMSIIGKGKIIYDTDNKLKELQGTVLEKYSKELPKIPDEKLSEDMLEMEEKFQELEHLKTENNDYFYQLYYLIIEKIVRLYHNINNIPRIELSKGFKIYTDDMQQ